MFFDRETSALSQTDDTRQRSSLAIMEIAAGPGRRPAPAAGRAGVSSTTVSKPSIFSRSSGRVRPRAEDLAARSLDRRALYRPCPATRSAGRSSTRCNVGATDRLDFTVISVGPRLTNQISGSPRWSPRGSTPGCCDSGLPGSPSAAWSCGG